LINCVLINCVLLKLHFVEGENNVAELTGSLMLAFFVVLLGTPFVKRLAYRVNALDEPEARKVHTQEMPRLGGLAICMGFWATVILTQEMTRELYGLLAGGLLITLVGLFDDIKGVTPKTKLFVQLIAAILVMVAGVKVDFITHPLNEVIYLQYLAYPVTLLWIIGITNAVNLIDGLDGLAAGVSAIAAITLGVVAYLETSQEAAVLAFLLAASILGFLRYNFHPAKIFMGDTGSLFLGFNLSVIAIITMTKSTTVFSVILPVIILGIPIADTLFAIIRRYVGGKPIFAADKDHLHHRLLNMGLSHKGTVLSIYGLSIVLGISAIIMASVTTAQGMLLMTALVLGFSIIAEKLGLLRSRKPQSQPKHAFHDVAK
jgi:UDP-GlcNAc:undecaprenyl-phosphate GlcNAc-1-phosphate transferase